MIWIVVTLLVLIFIAGWLVFKLSQSLGYEIRAHEDIEGALDIEEKRKDIAARPTASADSLLNRMRTEASDN